MSTKKHILERRERLRKIAEQDAANRCRFCRRALSDGFWEFIAADGQSLKYCAESCRADHVEAFEMGMA